MATTLSRVHHVGIIVQDLDRTMSFYDKLFGKEADILTEVDDSAGLARQFGVGDSAGDTDARMAFYDIDNTSIEFIEVKKPRMELNQLPVYQAGAKHLCFQVDDAQATYEAMVREGYEFKSRPARFDEQQPKLKGITFAYFTDPDGNIVEIMEDPNKQGLKGVAQKAGLANG